MAAAAAVRDAAHRHITFSPKVFIPLTRLCRDRCVPPPCRQRCASTAQPHLFWVQQAGSGSGAAPGPLLCTPGGQPLHAPYLGKPARGAQAWPSLVLPACSCGYCTFAMPPAPGRRAYMTMEEVLAVARMGAEQGCTEALFTLGEPLCR